MSTTVISSVGGTTSANIEARTADQYARAALGAFTRNTQDAGNSVGTKNDARTPIAIQ
jgi:hypothetical protein